MPAPRRFRASAFVHFVKFGPAALTLFVAWGAHAQAIHKCQVDGRLVYQSAPCTIEPRADAAPAATSPVATATARTTGPKKKTLADVLRERDGGDPAPAPRNEPRGDGANVLPSRMGAV
jgi:hypothetical protein